MKVYSTLENTHDGRADMTNFEMDLFDTRMSTVKAEKDEEQCCHSSRNRVIKPACLPITIISLLIIGLVFLPLFNEEDLEAPMKLTVSCDKKCDLRLAESIPTGLNFSSGPVNKATHEEWIDLLDNAEQFVEIAALYWNLNTSDYVTAKAGRDVYQAIIRAARRGVKVRIAQDISKGLSDNADSAWLQDQGLAEVRTLNFTSLVGSGVLHTKFIIADLKHVYLGSANMDWKALTEVKELGAVVRHCPCVAADLYKIFAVYWRLGEEDAQLPDQWPISFRTPYNLANQLPLNLNGITSHVFLSSSPEPFNPKGREHDLSAIVGLMERADASICVAVMDFIPTTLYMGRNRYWPALDDALRSAAFRGVSVRLLISQWSHSRSAELDYLRSLVAINPALKRGSIQVKLFTVPATEEQKKIEFTRVNHNKYMVTDRTAYIGTSNWAGDYFITTAGVGLSITPAGGEGGARQQLQDVFDRDWNSPYATNL